MDLACGICECTDVWSETTAQLKQLLPEIEELGEGLLDTIIKLKDASEKAVELVDTNRDQAIAHAEGKTFSVIGKSIVQYAAIEIAFAAAETIDCVEEKHRNPDSLCPRLASLSLVFARLANDI